MFFVMKRWSASQVCALVLALVLGLGSTLQSVQAGGMMDTIVDLSAAYITTPAGCGGCGDDTGDDRTDMLACFSLCVSAGPAILPVNSHIAAIAAADFRAALQVAATGLFGPPDPSPPKPA